MKNKNLWIQTGLILLCIIVFLLPVFIKNHGILIYYGDSFEEFYQFYLGGWEKVHALDFSQFDWSIGLGSNWFAYSDTYLFSPYFWITVLFPKAWMPYEMTILNILKLLLTFQFTYLWISHFSKNEATRFISSAMVTFSGWVFFYNHYTNFLDGYLMFPLILYFAEKFLQSGKYRGFVLSMFFLTLQSYYFAYMFMPFCCLYGLFRYLMIHHHIDGKDLIWSALKYFGCLMLGIAMAAFVLLPTAHTLFGNPRVEEAGLFQTISKYDFFKIFTSIFTPVFSRLDPDFFIAKELLGNLGWGNGCSLFTLILFPVLFFALFALWKKRKVRWLLAFYGILVIFIIFPFSWKILQGTVDTRWFFMFVFVNAFSASIVLDSYFQGEIKKSRMIASGIMVIALIALLFLFSFFKGLNRIEALKLLLIVLAIECIILAVYLLSFIFEKKCLLIIGVTSEIILSGSLHLYFNPPREYPLFQSELENACAVNAIKEMDNSFYRIIYDNDYYTSSNEPFAKNYAGVSFYYSIYNFEQEQYLNRYKTTWSMPMVSGRTFALNQLATKYWYTTNYTHTIPYGYTYLASYCGFDIYQNSFSFPLAMFMAQTVSAEKVSALNYFEQDIVMMDSMVVEESDAEPVAVIPFEKIGTFSAAEAVVLDLSAYNANSTLYFVPHEYNPEVTLTFYRDGQVVQKNTYYQVGYADHYLNWAQYDQIKIEYSFDLSGSFDVYIEDHDQKNYKAWYNEKQNDFIQDISVKKDYIQMRADSEKNQYLLTSIPYDQGWSCFVDGQEVSYFKANYGFIGLRIDAGEHTIIFKYEALWFKPGIIISVIGLLIFIFLSFKNKKGRKNTLKEDSAAN